MKKTRLIEQMNEYDRRESRGKILYLRIKTRTKAAHDFGRRL